MDKQVIDLIKKSGIKQIVLARKIGITPNYLSMCIKGRRKLSIEKSKKLKSIL